MATGTVKWFNATKGFGFIQPDSGGQDVFVHISAVERAGLSTLVDGQKVNYEIEQDRRTGKSSAGNAIQATVETIEYRGREYVGTARTESGFEMIFHGPRSADLGSRVNLEIDPRRALVFATGD